MELIKVENGVCVLSPEAAKKIAELELQSKAIKEAKDLLQETIKAEMEAKGIIKIDTPELRINYIQPSYRETFDSLALKKEDEETYNKYIKISATNASIRIKVK